AQRHYAQVDFTYPRPVASRADDVSASPAAFLKHLRHVAAHQRAGDFLLTINHQDATFTRLFHQFFEQLVILIDAHGLSWAREMLSAAEVFEVQWERIDLFAEFVIGIGSKRSHSYRFLVVRERMEGMTPPSISNCASLPVSTAAVAR